MAAAVPATADRRGCRAAVGNPAVAAPGLAGIPALMATPESGLVGVLVLLVFLLLGMPIGCALGLVGIGGLSLILGFEPALIKTGSVVFETLTRYELGTLPL